LEIEQRHEAPIIIVADDQLETPHFNVSRLREGEMGEETAKPSYHRTTPRKLETHALTKAQLNIPAAPAVTHVKPMQPAPIREPREELESIPPPVFKSTAPAKLGFFERIKAMFVGEPAPTMPARTDRNERNDRGDRGDRGDRNGARGNDPRRRDGRGGANRDQNREARGNRPQQQQNQARPPQGQQPAQPQQQKAQAPQQPKPERTEEQKRMDEARKLEQQQRREEQQRKEAERREAQRLENLKREADRRAARDAARAANPNAAMTVTVDPELAVSGQAPLASQEGASVTSDVAAPAPDANAEAAAPGEGARRRRGRRGGRRRRRQEGATPADPNAAPTSQSEIDFDEEESGAELSEAEGSEDSENLGTPLPFKAPTLASPIPVTTAESQFDDLDNEEATDALPPTVETAVTPTPERVADVAPPRTLVSETISVPAPAFTASAPVVTVAMPSIETIAKPLSATVVDETPSLPAAAALPAASVAVAETPTLPAASSAVIETPIPASEPVAANEGVWSQPTPEIRMSVNSSTVPPAFTAPAPMAKSAVEEVKIFAPIIVATSTEESADSSTNPQDESNDKMA
jgi:ribonuclease E